MDNFEESTGFSDGSHYPGHFPAPLNVKEERNSDTPQETACIYTTNLESAALDPLSFVSTSTDDDISWLPTLTCTQTLEDSSDNLPYILNTVSLAGMHNQWLPTLQSSGSLGNPIDLTFLEPENGESGYEMETMWTPTPIVKNEPVESVAYLEPIEQSDTSFVETPSEWVAAHSNGVGDPLDSNGLGACVADVSSPSRSRRCWESDILPPPHSDVMYVESITPPPDIDDEQCHNNVMYVSSLDHYDFGPMKIKLSPQPMDEYDDGYDNTANEQSPSSRRRLNLDNSLDDFYMDAYQLRKCHVVVKKIPCEISQLTDENDKSKSAALAMYQENFARELNKMKRPGPLSSKSKSEYTSSSSFVQRMWSMRMDFGSDCDDSFKCELCSYDASRHVSLQNIRVKDIHFVCKSFKCCSCSQILHSSSSLKSHMIYLHRESVFTCSLCKKQLTDRWSLHAHELTHTANKAECLLCGAWLANRKCLSRHTNMVHGIGLWKLRLEGHSATLPEASVTSSPESIFTCPICGKQLATKGKLQRHTKDVHSSPLPEASLNTSWEDTCDCPICGKTLSSNANMIRHVKEVHKLPDYFNECFICKVCDARFPSSIPLKRHIRIHTTPEVNVELTTDLIIQSVINAAYNDDKKSPDLNKIKLTLHQCLICKARFGSKSALHQHDSEQHKNDGTNVGGNSKSDTHSVINDKPSSPIRRKSGPKSKTLIGVNSKSLGGSPGSSVSNSGSLVGPKSKILNGVKLTTLGGSSVKISGIFVGPKSKILNGVKKSKSLGGSSGSSVKNLGRLVGPKSRILNGVKKSKSLGGTAGISVANKSGILVGPKSKILNGVTSKALGGSSESSVKNSGRLAGPKSRVLNGVKLKTLGGSSESSVKNSGRLAGPKSRVLNGVKLKTLSGSSGSSVANKSGSSVVDKSGSLIRNKSKTLNGLKSRALLGNQLRSLVGTPCLDCGKIMKSSAYVSAHKQLHSMQKVRHECTICQKCYSSQRDLLEHKLSESHVGYQCDICKRVLGVRKHLRRHIQKHATNKNYCAICQVLFASKYQLIEHNKDIHSASRGSAFSCMLTPTSSK